MNTNTKKVAILGAGVAGLATARSLLGEGFECTLFERNSLLGGVWSDGYINFGVQVQRELYEFPDWPIPENTPDFASGPIIEKYLSDFSDHFKITPHIEIHQKPLPLISSFTHNPIGRQISVNIFNAANGYYCFTWK